MSELVQEPPLKRRRLNPCTTPEINDKELKLEENDVNDMICNGCNNKLNPCIITIKCRECTSSNSIICIDCFKKGIEFNEHKRFHRYSVLSPINYSINDKDNNVNTVWTAKDVFNLIEGIRKFGIGNWSQIAKIINNPLINRHKCQQYVMDKFGKPDIDKITRNNSPKSPKKTKSPIKSGKEVMTKKDMENYAKLLECGYNPKRKEFEVKWKNDSEEIISEMFLSPFDVPSERKLKLQGIGLYNKSIFEREERKKYILSSNYGVVYGLNEKYIKNKQNKEIFDNMSMFAHFAENKQQFRSLIDGLIEEKELRQKIYKIKHYLLNGITSIDEMNKIEKYYKQNQNDKNKEHKYSLDKISEYLKQQRRNDLIYNKKKLNRRLSMKSKENGNHNHKLQNDMKEDIDFDITKCDNYNTLNNGEKKLCQILKIRPNHYKFIQKRIGDYIDKYGLMQSEAMKNALHLEIDDNFNGKDNLNIKIGVVNPQNLDSFA